MTPDLTGWTPFTGGNNPAPDVGNGPPEVRVLLRGAPGDGEKSGPRESGPALSTVFSWAWNREHPAGDIVGWRHKTATTPFTRYPHVRADMGIST